MRKSISHDNRAVSVAVTHVLTVGITAILISGLLLGSSSLLETQQERSAENALTTIGERLGSEITSLNQSVTGGETASINTSHQRQVAGSQYTVTLLNSGCSTYPLVDSSPCVVLESQGQDVTVAIPLSEEIEVDDGATVTGGGIEIVYDGSKITVRSGQ